jgi:hypothetical protein
MTKLEEKLLELGYTKSTNPIFYIKTIITWDYIINIKNIELSYVISTSETDIILKSQDDIEYFQTILNLLQQDLEILKQYEKD